MKILEVVRKFLLQEDLNFLLTNRIPRRSMTLFMGRFSKIKIPIIKCASIGIWKFFSKVDFSDSAETKFDSLHDAFIRKLKPGSRTIDPCINSFVSPCDGIIGAHGNIKQTVVFQAKGYPYSLFDLLPNKELVNEFESGIYITIRITAGMYHRFHAPYDCEISKVTYISGDTWNVNPIALKRIEKLFCKNERAVIESELSSSHTKETFRFLMVPIAAILVASIRLNFINVLLNLKYKGTNPIGCSASYKKGQELGWFEHGSTIILILPPGSKINPDLKEGDHVRVGQSLVEITL